VARSNRDLTPLPPGLLLIALTASAIVCARDQKTKKLCLAEVRTKYISEADFVSALAANRDVPLRVVVSLSS